MIKVFIFHNLLWSKYKGGVFSAIQTNIRPDIKFYFIHIAETDNERAPLSSIDISYHKYIYEILFRSSYENIPKKSLIYSTTSAILKSKADLILLPGYHQIEYWSMLLVCIILGKKRAVFCDSTIHDRPRHWLKSIAKRIFFSLCDGYFGYGERSREYLLSHGAKPERIFHRCQAAALPHDYTPVRARAERLLNAILAPRPRYLYVGRLSPEKGLDTLLTAFKTVLGTYPKAELVLVGSGPLRTELGNMVDQLGISANVSFTGGLPIETIVNEYAKATCLILPSRSEPWGLVVNEALSYGCPVVVSHVCGCVPELVIDGVTGFSYRNDEPEQLANCMLKLTAEFNDVAAVADRCMNLIANFSPEHAAQQILYGCREILHVPHPA